MNQIQGSRLKLIDSSGSLNLYRPKKKKNNLHLKDLIEHHRLLSEMARKVIKEMDETMEQISEFN